MGSRSLPQAKITDWILADLFTPIFAIAHTSGWTAQVLEQLRDSRLYRPPTLYVGPKELSKVPPISEC